MKRIILISIAFLLLNIYRANLLFGQGEITWTFSYNLSDNCVEMKANLASGWHVYSTDLGGIAGPIPTTFAFEKNKNVILEGKVAEPAPKVEFDPNFEETVKYFDKEVVFTQKARLKKKPTTLKGNVVYMICNDKMCLPPVEQKFEVLLEK